MRKPLSALLVLLLALGLLAGCAGTGGTASTPAGEEPVIVPDDGAIDDWDEPFDRDDDDRDEDDGMDFDDRDERDDGMVYRGIVTAMLEDGGIEVEQVYGYNYGYDRVVFHIDGDTDLDDDGIPLAEGAFVEVEYNGILTRSDPPQGTADEIHVLAAFGDGIVLNGTIQEVSEKGEGYTLSVLPFDMQPPADTGFEAETESGIEGVLPEAGLANDVDNVYIVHVEADDLEHITVAELVPGTQVSVVTRGIMAMSMPPQVSAHALLPFAP